MEPREAELKKSPEQRKDARKRRFQIVKLEERIAPGCSFHHRRYVGHCGYDVVGGR